MTGPFRRLVRRLGFDVAPFPGAAGHWPRIVGLLHAHQIDVVFDVGANTGQYVRALRNNGWQGRVVSFEPVAAAHARISAAAEGDPAWTVAPRGAVGAAAGEIDILVSPESDMSSALPLTATAHDRLKSTRPHATERVPVVTLEDAIARFARPGDAVFVKSDTQGFEDRVLDGLGEAASRVAGVQLELSLQPIYEGQPDHLTLLNRLDGMGLRPHLVIPGYWSRHYLRMLEYDVVCFRD